MSTGIHEEDFPQSEFGPPAPPDHGGSGAEVAWLIERDSNPILYWKGTDVGTNDDAWTPDANNAIRFDWSGATVMCMSRVMGRGPDKIKCRAREHMFVGGGSALRRISAAPEKASLSSVVTLTSDEFDELERCMTEPAKPTEAIKRAAEMLRRLYPRKAEPAASVPVTQGAVQDVISDWLYSLSESQAVGLRGIHAARLRDAILALLASHSPPVETRAAGVGEQVEEIAERHESWQADFDKHPGVIVPESHRDRATLLALIRRQHGGEGEG